MNLHTIRDAATLLRPHLPVTRLVPAPSLTRAGSAIHLKLETDLPTGSFKPRGAIYALSVHAARRPIREVTACSTGNHGAAVAYAAKLLGYPATIFLPANPNPVKRARIAALGAKIELAGADDLAGAHRAASEFARGDGVYFLNDATEPDLPAGPGTIALEILEQRPSADTIIVPMGDTALIRGVAAAAKALKSDIAIIGVQAEKAPSYYLSWNAGKVVPTDTCDTIADGLATRRPEAENVATIRKLVDQVVLVSEEEMLRAIRQLAVEEHLVAEPAGAAATAVVMQGKVKLGRETVALVTGANVAPAVLEKALCGGAGRMG